MAIYSASINTIGRTAGRSATAAAAYRTGSLVIDERQGLIHDYTRKSGVDHVSRHYPHGISDMGTDDLWNRAELAEVKCNANVARELLVALPHELDGPQRRILAEDIARGLVERYQVAAESSVHLPDKEGDQRNHHAHIQFTTRVMNSDGGLGEKTRALDEKYGRGPKEIEWIREMVEVKTNAALEAAGLDVRVDRRSLKDQRSAALSNGDLEKAVELDREPTQHEGPRVTQIRRECAREGRMPLGALDRAAANDSIGFDVKKARAELASIDTLIARAEAQEAAQKKAISIDELRTRLTEIKDTLKAKDSRFIDLKIAVYHTTAPDFVYNARQLKNARDGAVKAAQAWRAEHPLRAAAADRMGIKLDVDAKATEATDAYRTSPDLRQAVSWERQRKSDFAEINSLKTEISDLKSEGSEIVRELKLLDPPTDTADSAVQRTTSAGSSSLARSSEPSAAGIGDSLNDLIDIGVSVTGVKWIDDLARSAKKSKDKLNRESLAASKRNSEIKPAP